MLPMLCQICGQSNPDDAEHCRRCGQKLLVVSGDYTDEDQEAFEDPGEGQMSFDEHLLERVSLLEEVAKRSATTLRQVLGTLYKLEQKILVNHTGVTTLRDLLEEKDVLGHDEWSELWEARMDRQLLALEKRERFQAARGRIGAVYSGTLREAFAARLDEADRALLGLEVDAAVEVLERAQELDPANYELSFFLGETYLVEGRTREALAAFEQALGARPDHFESLVYAGVLHHERGDDGRAVALLEKADALSPGRFLPAFGLGAVHAARGRLDRAVPLLERALSGDTEEPRARLLLGSCCYELGRLGPAIRHLREAVRLDPSLEEAHRCLGLASLDRGWSRKAEAAFALAECLRPGRLEHREVLAWLAEEREGSWVEIAEEAEALLRAGRGRRALALLRSTATGDPALLVAYAAACVELDRQGEVDSVLRRALDRLAGERHTLEDGAAADDAAGDPVPCEPTGAARLASVARALGAEALRTGGDAEGAVEAARALRAADGSAFGQALSSIVEALARVACADRPAVHSPVDDGGLSAAESTSQAPAVSLDRAASLDAALTQARTACDVAPPSLRAAALDALGRVCAARGEIGDAIAALEASVATVSGDLPVVDGVQVLPADASRVPERTLTQLGLARLAAGEIAAARTALALARRARSAAGGVGVRLLETLHSRRPFDASS